MSKSDETQAKKPRRKPGRWKRRLKWIALAMVVVLALVAYAIKNHVRTLWSLRRVAGTNCYVMDYYVDYHMDEVRAEGIDVENVEGEVAAHTGGNGLPADAASAFFSRTPRIVGFSTRVGVETG